MNIFTFTGRLTRDAETRNTNAGKSVTGFSVANDIGFGDKKRTNFIDCALWGERGEKLCQYLTKGMAVTISGEVEPHLFEGRDAVKAVLKVNVREVELQGGKRDDAGQGNQQRSQGRTAPAGEPFDEIPWG